MQIEFPWLVLTHVAAMVAVVIGRKLTPKAIARRIGLWVDCYLAVRDHLRRAAKVDSQRELEIPPH